METCNKVLVPGTIVQYKYLYLVSILLSQFGTVDTNLAMQSSNTIIACLDGIINRLGDGSRRKRAHAETNQIDDDLYRLLYPCLVQRKNNAAAFVMGSRGCGKSRLVENCLARMDQSKFHTLRLNGLVIRGNDVGFAVNELVRQLSELAVLHDGETGTNDLVRLKRTTFTSNLALLDEMLHLAKVHHRPILIILDEMDAFAGSSAQLDVASNTMERSADRQLLLYHILDRVSTPGSSVCFIGITSHLAAISLLEKRVRSRAEGTAQIFIVNPLASQSALIVAKVRRSNST
jgi:Cdc6-like AAA superfamily ATPase